MLLFFNFSDPFPPFFRTPEVKEFSCKYCNSTLISGDVLSVRTKRTKSEKKQIPFVYLQSLFLTSSASRKRKNCSRIQVQHMFYGSEEDSDENCQKEAYNGHAIFRMAPTWSTCFNNFIGRANWILECGVVMNKNLTLARGLSIRFQPIRSSSPGNTSFLCTKPPTLLTRTLTNFLWFLAL